MATVRPILPQSDVLEHRLTTLRVQFADNCGESTGTVQSHIRAQTDAPMPTTLLEPVEQ
jgi:hypothetical protein